MGSMPHGTFHGAKAESAEDALQEARLAFYEALNVDLRAVLEGYAQANRDAAKSCEESGDEYGLKKDYLEEAVQFETLAMGTLPSEIMEEMEIYRDAIGRYTSEGCGNILDFRGISDDDLYGMRVMSADEIEDAFGTKTPSRADIDAGWHQLWGPLERGCGICCRYYESERLVGWWFLGATVD